MENLEKITGCFIGVGVAMLLIAILIPYLSPQEVIQEDKSCVKQEVRNDT